MQTGSPSFGRLLSNFTASFAVIAVPFCVIAILPLTWGMASLAGIYLLASLTAAHRRHWARHIARYAAGGVLGLGLRVWLMYPFWWGFVLALTVIMSGFALYSHQERTLKLVRRWVGTTTHYPESRTLDLLCTPEGDPIRVLEEFEAHFGPVVCRTILFTDGIVLSNVGNHGCFSRDGRFFAAVEGGGAGKNVSILDRKHKRVYQTPDTAGFWASDEFSDSAPQHGITKSGWAANSDLSWEFQDFLAESGYQNLIAVSDLWIDPRAWAHRLSVDKHVYPSPENRHRLTATIRFPDNLRSRDNPLDSIYYPVFELTIDNEPSNLLLKDTDSILWRPDAGAVVCRAATTGDDSSWDDSSPDGMPATQHFWLWEESRSWRQLPSVWVPAAAEPGITLGKPMGLDQTTLWVYARINGVELEWGDHGYDLHESSNAPVIATGHENNGQLTAKHTPCTSVRLGVPLYGTGTRGQTRVESWAMADGKYAYFTWHHDNALGLGGWQCRMGDWELPGLWLLEHRVSDCGGYIALCPFSESLPFSDGIAVAFPGQHILFHGPKLPIARILDFCNGVLSAIQAPSRRNETSQSPDTGNQALNAQVTCTPLHPYDLAASTTPQAGRLPDTTDGASFHYCCRRLCIKETGLVPLPDWRGVNVPQVANADGQFVYASPDKSDAAWYFGSECTQGNPWNHPDAPRGNGYLLTASGCAVYDLAPSMIWSGDSRYLALSRLSMQNTQGAARRWYPLVLNPEYGLLYTGPALEGRVPVFEQFDDNALLVRTCGNDGSKGAGQRKRIEMAAVMGTWPVIRLVGDTGLRLPPDRQGDIALWRSLNKTPLAQWARY